MNKYMYIYTKLLFFAVVIKHIFDIDLKMNV